MRKVRLLKPEELGLSEKIQKFEDGLRTEPKSGSYEWWYFDSKYPDGSSLVIKSHPFYIRANVMIYYLCEQYCAPAHKEIDYEKTATDSIICADVYRMRRDKQ